LPDEWVLIAEKFNQIGICKSGKQCRERWLNYVNPIINHDKLSEEEEGLLFEYFKEYGKKWVDISKKFKGRSENAVKNAFYSQIRRNSKYIQKKYKEYGIKSLLNRIQYIFK